MNVNIVYPNMGDGTILAKLVRILADGTGWTISDQPNGGADVNYFGIYLDFAQRFTDWRRTTLAAYFSHYETDQPYKKFWWESAAPLIDIHMVTAQKYGDLLPGAVHLAPAPLDWDELEIRERTKNGTHRLGVAGQVYSTGRKGEHMAARLAGAMEGRAEVVAFGIGWPLKILSNDLSKRAWFYNQLDAYVCTSLIEGVPMPPLEALACGVPIVIPRNVGMLDELPDIPGIYRYKCGDYDGLRKACELALSESGTHDREALRASVAHHTPGNWCRAHINAFEKAEKKSGARGDALSRSVDLSQHGQRGAYYVAYGGPARECAKGAIASFKKHMPDIPVALVSTEPLGIEDVFIQHEDEDIGGRAAKVRIDELAPKDWSYILYLDADTEIVAPIYQFWQWVEDDWDLVICRNPGRFHTAREMVRPDNKDECEITYKAIGADEVLQLNGGVFCYQRNKRTKAFFAKWHQEWARWSKRDQAALLRALWQHPLRLWVLGNEWNTITRYCDPATTAGILHYPMTARRWRGVVDHPLNSPEAWRAVKNFEEGGNK